MVGKIYNRYLIINDEGTVVYSSGTQEEIFTYFDGEYDLDSADEYDIKCHIIVDTGTGTEYSCELQRNPKVVLTRTAGLNDK